MQVNESIEDYLEQILIQQEKNGCARSVDIAISLGVTKASVSHATKLLRENDYIHMADDKCITLTDSGREIAERMYQRHRVLAQFLMRLGVQEDNRVCGCLPHRARYLRGNLRRHLPPRGKRLEIGVPFPLGNRQAHLGLPLGSPLMFYSIQL